MKDEKAYDGPALLFDKKKANVGVYAGFGVAYTPMLNRDGALLSGELALLVDHRLSFGLGASVFSRTPQGPLNEDGEEQEFLASYGGIVMRYAVYAKDFPVYLTFGALFGGGAVALVRELKEEDFDDDNYDGEEFDHDDVEAVEPFMVVQPEMFFHVNATRWLRFGAGGGYRFATAVPRFGYDRNTVGGAVIGGNIALGWL